MTTMAVSQQHRKRRRRRRRADKPAISAKLVLDDSIKGEVGSISEDLYRDLFPCVSQEPPSSTSIPATVHIAIAPWLPNSTSSTTDWTILPVTSAKELKHSCVHFSPNALALQRFATQITETTPSKLAIARTSGIEILLLDVVPLPLETVFVQLDADLAKRLENGEGTFFGTRGSGKGKGKAAASTEDALTAALRLALGPLQVVHNDDLFPLPLPPHQITHVPSNPGKVVLCEPVAQGLLSSTTRIIVTRRTAANSKAGRERVITPVQPDRRRLNEVIEDDEDTANDFYSANEDRHKTETETDATETEESGEEQDDLSDDSPDESISLQIPSLPGSIPSGVSTLQAGTPMTVIGRGRALNGIATPGSVFSSFTATTARPDQSRGRRFKAQPLMLPIPSELLHPKVSAEDDAEARIYVDVRDLTKIGCFSGDWIKVEAAEEPTHNGIEHLNFHLSETTWRPMRVYGLPEGYSTRPLAKINKATRPGLPERRSSFFEAQIRQSVHPVAYLSPIGLFNLKSSGYLRLSPLSSSSASQVKQSGHRRPPLAQELILEHIRTPSTVKRDVQSAIMAGLKAHFEDTSRLLCQGDIVAVPFDAGLGRLLKDVDESLLAIGDMQSTTRNGAIYGTQDKSIAWLQVKTLAKDESTTSSIGEANDDVWGQCAVVDITTTRLQQSGSTTSRIPGVKSSTWQEYLGVRVVSSRGTRSTQPVPVQSVKQPYLSSLQRQLRDLVSASTSPRAAHLGLPPTAILLVSTQRNTGKSTAVRDACSDVGLHTFTIDAYDLVNDAGSVGGGDIKTEGFFKARAERALSCGADCCVLLVKHIECLTAERMTTAFQDILRDSRVLVATTTEVDKIPDGMRALFTHELEVSAPDERQRQGILDSVIASRGITLDSDVDMSSIALKTAALVAGDLVDVVDRAVVAQQSRLESLIDQISASADTSEAPTLRDLFLASGAGIHTLTSSDFEVAVEAARKNFANSIGAPKIPNVTWNDVGGLDHVREAITETIQLPLQRPELFAKGMKKRSGILFYGPPGTGKTLVAKAIATEYSLNFFSVKGPELLNMYIGESEANVRRVFQRARDARPCVVFFDELDSVAPKRGNQGDSGGVMDRIVSQLLAELDGMSSSGGGSSRGDGTDQNDDAGGVFVIGATNRPDLLDPALLRPGRFDKMLYLGVPDTHQKQLTILEALTRKITLHPTISLSSVAQTLPYTYTGADLYALCSDAMLKAVTRQASLVDIQVDALNKSRPKGAQTVTTARFFDHFAKKEDVAVMITEKDFADAQRELVPSVSAGELEHYRRVRASFEGGSGGGGGRSGAARPVERSTMRRASEQKRITSGGSGRTVVSSGRALTATAASDGKGKGKAPAQNDHGDEDEDDDDDQEYETAGGEESGWFDHDYRNKGKGKAVAADGFRHGRASDDDGMYD